MRRKKRLLIALLITGFLVLASTAIQLSIGNNSITGAAVVMGERVFKLNLYSGLINLAIVTLGLLGFYIEEKVRIKRMSRNMIGYIR
ncbi:hypothetical protein D6745_04115 [Candidatus Woesearchaeota archaeon]|nr:MAG: hypothetical protein D6745_04115 [Candidatus Woesearchaeota archaeon]